MFMKVTQLLALTLTSVTWGFWRSFLSWRPWWWTTTRSRHRSSCPSCPNCTPCGSTTTASKTWVRGISLPLVYDPIAGKWGSLAWQTLVRGMQCILDRLYFRVSSQNFKNGCFTACYILKDGMFMFQECLCRRLPPTAPSYGFCLWWTTKPLPVSSTEGPTSST